MEVKLISHDDESIEIEIIGENETFLYPLRKRLLDDKMVTYASYFLGHPLLDNPRVDDRVSDGKPLEALQRATKALNQEYRDLREQFEKVSA